MARRHHYRRRVKEPTELDVTTFLNLMVVLVPFLAAIGISQGLGREARISVEAGPDLYVSGRQFGQPASRHRSHEVRVC